MLAGGAEAALGAPASTVRPAPRPAIPTDAQVADRLIARAGLGDTVSFALADMRSGEIVAARKPLLRQPPASTAKTITALYALDRLGPRHRFATQLLATGPLRDGRIEGDLVLAGGGDPTLDTDGLGVLAERIEAAGVRAVAGRYLVWPGALPRIGRIDPDQPEHVGYNPALSGLNLNYNRVHFAWERAAEGYEVSLLAPGMHHAPAVRSARMQVVDRAGPIYTYTAAPGVDEWTVARKALGRNGARWLPVRNPARYAAEVFGILARGRGLALPEPEIVDAEPAGTLLCEVKSADVQSILRDMLHYSNNMTAEVVGLAASAAAGVAPSGLAASAARMNAWVGAGMDGREPRLVDHSGLGQGSRIAAADMVRTLVRLGAQAPLPPLLKPFELGDGATADVSAKTGTLNFVNALVGYMTAQSGRPLAFAIYTSDLARRDALTLAERERPEGGRAWAGRARTLQRELLRHWAVAHA